MSKKLTEGWVDLTNARKWHYVRNARSLCLKYGYFGSIFEAENGASPDDCAECRKRLNKELEQSG